MALLDVWNERIILFNSEFLLKLSGKSAIKGVKYVNMYFVKLANLSLSRNDDVGPAAD